MREIQEALRASTLGKSDPLCCAQHHGYFLARFGGPAVRVDREPEESMVLRLAGTHGLSVYDAPYLELALREAMPFALNAQLTAAARAEGSGLI